MKPDAKLARLRDKYAAHVERTFALLGDAPAVAKRNAEAVVTLEKALAEEPYRPGRSPRSRNLHHTMDREGFEKSAPAFKWDVYLKELGSPAPAA